MNELRFAIVGTGFWSRYQLAAWRELPGVRCVALYNRTRAKAEKLAAEFAVPSVYDDTRKDNGLSGQDVRQILGICMDES